MVSYTLGRHAYRTMCARTHSVSLAGDQDFDAMASFVIGTGARGAPGESSSATGTNSAGSSRFSMAEMLRGVIICLSEGEFQPCIIAWVRPHVGSAGWWHTGASDRLAAPPRSPWRPAVSNYFRVWVARPRWHRR